MREGRATWTERSDAVWFMVYASWLEFQQITEIFPQYSSQETTKK
jgi:hypothetical protein